MKLLYIIIAILLSLQAVSQIAYSVTEMQFIDDSTSNQFNNKLSDFDKPLVKINFLFPGVGIEKSLFNFKHTAYLNYGFLPIYDFSGFYQGYNKLTIIHMLNFEYRYYFNIEKRIFLGQSVGNYQANYISLYANDFIHKHPLWLYLEEKTTLNFLAIGISVGGNVNFWNIFYLNYGIGLGVHFLNGEFTPFYQSNISGPDGMKEVKIPVAPNFKFKVGINI